MCFAAAIILLIWGFTRVVPSDDPEAPPRRSPSGGALLGAVLMVASAMTRIDQEVRMLPFMLILPAACMGLRAVLRGNRLTRILLCLLLAAEVVGIVAVLRRPVVPPPPEESREIVAAARASLRAIENGRETELREAVAGLVRERRREAMTSGEFRAAVEKAAQLPPIPRPAPPPPDERAFGTRFVDVTLTSVRYWFAIFTMAGAAALVIIAPFYIIAGMQLSYPIRLLCSTAVILVAIGVAIFVSRRPPESALPRAVGKFHETLSLPDGAIRSEYALHAFLEAGNTSATALAGCFKTILDVKASPPPYKPKEAPGGESAPAGTPAPKASAPAALPAK